MAGYGYPYPAAVAPVPPAPIFDGAAKLSSELKQVPIRTRPKPVSRSPLTTPFHPSQEEDFLASRRQLYEDLRRSEADEAAAAEKLMQARCSFWPLCIALPQREALPRPCVLCELVTRVSRLREGESQGRLPKNVTQPDAQPLPSRISATANSAPARRRSRPAARRWRSRSSSELPRSTVCVWPR